MSVEAQHFLTDRMAQGRCP
uniref:Uncharacterized protein n=1 Tax=Anguilla anguilla TaxID=7936 RepID=A0A0E9VB07_ANGAN